MMRKSVLKSWFSTAARRSFEEVRIPMRWGYLAGKWWGPRTVRPIIAFHGWQDTCGSFDTLIPLLPGHLSYLALDFPGHGHSSRLPPGMLYNQIDVLLIMRILQTHFKWPKLSLMGHSMGAIACFTFAGFYPSAVDLLLCLDGLCPLVNAKRLDRVTATIDAYLKYEKHADSLKEPRAYAMDELCAMVHKGSLGSVDLAKCLHLLERNIRPSKAHPGKFCFSRDPRVKAGPLMNWPVEDILAHAQRVQAPTFVSLSHKAPPANNRVIYDQVKSILAQNTQFLCHCFNGKHHVHLNTPEYLAGMLTDFILQHDKADRRIEVI